MESIAVMTSPIDFYYWPTPNGWKISIALEEMGLPYTVKPLNITKGEQFEPAFLSISPNNRMPAIVDLDGPDGAPVSVFESGAILQYLARKSGKFYGSSECGRIAVDEWVFWQVSNLGPVSGQYGHFRNYAVTMVDDPSKLDYALNRFRNEVDRLFGVMERQFGKHEYLAGPDYSIADMACVGWLLPADRVGMLAAFPGIKAWFDKVVARPGVQKGLALRQDLRDQQPNLSDPKQDDKAAAEARKILFGQTASGVVPSTVQGTAAQ
jgi:glutathione S-transferase